MRKPQGWLLALGLFAVATTTSAHDTSGLRHTFYYLGLSTGAGFAHFQGSDNYFETDVPTPPALPYMSCHRNEVSARGYSGGLQFGYNFYCCNNVLLGIELSGNLYSNRGYYTVAFYNPNNNNSALFEFSVDVDFSVHATLRPQYVINDCNLVYGQIGLAYADFNVRGANLIAANVGDNPNPVDNRESSYGLTLGCGLQHRASAHLSIFAAYEYTRYRELCLNDVLQTPPIPQMLGGAFRDRTARMDTSLFKLGLLFTF